jgi:hypothetical protein
MGTIIPFLQKKRIRRAGSAPRGEAETFLGGVHFEGGVLLPPGETMGGQGRPEGAIPGVAEFPWPFPEVEGDAPGFDDPAFDEPAFDEPGLEDPAFGVGPLGDAGVPGKVPHGDPLGLVPGTLGVFGSTVEGCTLLPGVGGFGEFEPGTVGGVLRFVVPVGGVTGVVGGGVVVPVGGVAVPGVWACPLDP